MIGEKVSVWLNGDLVVDNVTMENYWDRKIPIFPKDPSNCRLMVLIWLSEIYMSEK